MSPFSRQTVAMALFGLAVIASGLIRYLTTTGGENGLYFGLVMGGLALIGALLAAFQFRLAGMLVGLMAIAFVVLWFGYDTYRDVASTHKFGSAEVRKAIVVALGIITAVALFAPSRHLPKTWR